MINKELVQIIQADKAARERICDSDELASRMNVKLAEDKTELEKKYSDKSEKEIKENAEKQLELINKAKEQYDAKLIKAKEKIQRQADEHKNKWVREIVCNVTGAN